MILSSQIAFSKALRWCDCQTQWPGNSHQRGASFIYIAPQITSRARRAFHTKCTRQPRAGKWSLRELALSKRCLEGEKNRNEKPKRQVDQLRAQAETKLQGGNPSPQTPTHIKSL